MGRTWSEAQKKEQSEKMKKVVINLNEGEPVEERPVTIGYLPDAFSIGGAVSEVEEIDDKRYKEIFESSSPLIKDYAHRVSPGGDITTLRGIVSGLEDRILMIEERLGIKRK